MMNEQMEFPKTWEEYEQEYGFNDSEEVYTNNSRLIPSFRVKQWLDHLPSIQPKTGHWIMTNDYLTTAYGSVDYVKCSCCGEDSLEEGNYCPNCGAEMESEVEE